MFYKKNIFIVPLLCLLPFITMAQSKDDIAGDRGFEIAKNLEIFSNVYKNINLYYVDDVEPGKAMKTAINAMLASLDPYTNYYPESSIEDVKLQLMGEYGGVGALIHQKGDSIYVAEPYEGFPAQKAGIKAGDRYVSINGESVAGKKVSDVSEKLRGQAGTTVEVELERDGRILKMVLKREKVKFPAVPYFGIVKGSQIGYIKLNEFTQGAALQVRQAFEKLRQEQPSMQGVILDLRGNGGGLMNEAVDLVNIFVKRGEMIVETKGKIASRNSKSYTTQQPVDLKIPLAVLVDGSSASASEIVSGSLQDLDRAVIIGSRTYGKGLVQNVLPMDYNTQMKVTVSKYYIPSGRCVQAIDYAHRDENGRPLAVPDSLKTAYKTKNGRTVYDGFGIEPDVEIPVEYMNMLEVTLMQKFFIFDYATQYAAQHPTIPPAADFKITDDIYNDFKSYLSKQHYEYKTATERIIDEVRKMAKDESYLDSISGELMVLEQQLKDAKAHDLDLFRPQVSMLLKSEILSRYYYQKGRIEGSLTEDPGVEKAIEVLMDKEGYNKKLKTNN